MDGDYQVFIVPMRN